MDLFKKVSEGAKSLGEGLSEGAKSLSKKSSEMVGVAKLKYEMAKMEKEMENNMAALGKLTYLRSNGEEIPQEEIERLLGSSRELEKDMAELAAQIEKLAPKPPVCPDCQKELSPEAKFCSFCGSSLKQTE
jgi:rRNA maturation endonuclease Nob1